MKKTFGAPTASTNAALSAASAASPVAASSSTTDSSRAYQSPPYVPPLVQPTAPLQPATPPELTQAMKYVTFDLPTSGPVTLSYAGDYFFIDAILSGTTPLDLVDNVTAKADTINTDVLLRYPKQGTRWPQAFNSLQLTNGSGSNLTIKGWMGFGEIVTQVLTSDNQASSPVQRLGTAEITRPANVTPYTIGDAVNNAAALGIAISGVFLNPDAVANGVIVGASLIKSSNTTANASFRAYLLNTQPSGITDNAAFNFDYTTYNLAIIGVIDFPSFVAGPGAGSAAVCSVADFSVPLKAENTQVFYVVLVALAAYAPTSAEKFRLAFYGNSSAYANP